MAAWYDEESELNPAVPSSTAPALPAPGSNPLIQAYQRGLSGEGLPDIQSLLPNYSGSQSVANGLSQYGPAMTPEEYSAYQQQFAPQEAPQEKPFFDLSNTGSALWDAAKSLGTTLPSAYYQFQEGLKRPDEYSPEAKSAFAAQKELEKQNEAITQAQVAANDTDSVSESIREAIPSLGFSGISMGAAIPAGLAGGALTQAAMPMLPGAGVIGGIASSMGASGAASYRMMGNQVLNDVFSAAEAKSQQENKRGLSEEEKAKLYADMRPVAEDSALWEAGPEAVGNALMMVGGGIALKYLGKEALSKIAGGAFKKAGIRAGAAAAAVGGELATETTTQYNQGNNQAKIDAYLSGKPMDEAIQAYQGLEGVGKAFKEVAPPTLAMLGMFGLVGGAVKTGSKIHERFVQNPRDAETLVRLAENPEVLTAMPEQSLQNLSVLGGWLQGKTKNPGLEVALGNINQEIDSRNSETEEVQQERQKVLGKLWESMQPQQKAGILSFLGNDAPGLTGWTDKDGMATGDIDLAGLDRMQSILGVAGAGMNFRKDGITARDQQKNQEIADAQQAEARLNTKVAGLPSFNELNSMNPVEFDQFRQTLSQKPDVLDQLNPQEQQDWLNLFDQKIESFTPELEATRKYASTVGADPAVLAQEVNARRVADPQNPRPYLDTLNDTVVEKQRSLLSGEIAAIQQQMDSGQPVDTGRLTQRRVILEQQLQGLQGEIDKPATPLESLSVTPRPVGQPSAPSSAVPATPIDLPTIRSQAIQAYQQSAEAQALDGQIAAHQGLLNGLPPVPQMRTPIEQKITQLTEQKAQYEQAAVAKAVEAAQAKNAQALSGLGFNESTAPQSVAPGVPAPEVPSANSGWLGGSLPTSDETTNNLSTNPASALPGISVPNPVSTPAPLAIPESARPAPKSVPVSNPLTGQVIDIDTSGDSAALNFLRQMAAQVAASQPAPAVVQPQSVTPRIAPRLMSSQEMREAMNSPTPIQPWEVSLPVWNKVLGAIGQPAITQEAHDTLVQYAKTAGLIAAKPKAKAAETVTETGKKEKGKKGKKDKEAKVETPVPVVPPVVSTNPVPTPVVTPTPTPTSSNPPSSKPAAASSKPPTTGAVNKQRVNTINPKKDSIRRATALAGGWNRIDAEKTHGIDPAEFTTTEGNAPALGAMVFPAQGGLTAEQLSEILGPLGYDVHSNDNTGDTKADGQAFALAFSNPDRQYTADAKIIQDEAAREAAERERVLQHNDSDYQTVTATGQDDKGNPINWVWEVRPVKDKLGYFSLHSSRRGVRSKTNEQGRMVPEGKMMVVVTETNGLDVIGKAIRQQAGNIDIKADDLIAPDILNSIPPYEEPAAKPELSPEARDAMMNAVDGDIEKGNPIEVELLEILGIDIPDGWRVENIPASDGKSYATAIPPDKAFENGKWVDREVVDEENTDINLDAKGNSEPLVADDEVIPEPAPAEDEVTELDDDVGTKAAEQKSETKDSNTQASRSPTKSPGISRADFLPAIRKRFPHISNAIEKMLVRGEKGQQGGLVLVESADLNEIARVFAEKTRRTQDQAVVELKGDNALLNGLYDPRTGLVFAILPNLSPETAGPVVLHEGLHAQPSDEMIRQAVDMVNNREAVKRPEMREFLNIVNARLETAKAKDDPREYPNYIVEVAAQMGRQNGFNYADGKFLDWVDAKLSKFVGDIIRKFVNAIRAMMFKVGYPMKWSALTVDDLMNFAVDSLERAAKGDVKLTPVLPQQETPYDRTRILDSALTLIFGNQNTDSTLVSASRKNGSGTTRNGGNGTGVSKATSDAGNGVGLAQPGNYLSLISREVGAVKVDTFRTGIRKVETPEQAASVLAPIGDEAQEFMTALVTDAKERPLAIIRHSIGTGGEVQVEMSALIGSILNVPKAANVWFAHNHPGQKSTQSKSDIDFTESLDNLLRGSGIFNYGMIVIAANRNATFVDPADLSEIKLPKAISVGSLPVPVLGRRFQLFEDGEKLPTTTDKKDYLKKFDNSGILLLDRDEVPLAWIAMDTDQMRQLRKNNTDQGASILLRIIERTNAVRLAIKVNDLKSDKLAVQNLTKFAYAANMVSSNVFDKKGNAEQIFYDFGEVFKSVASPEPISNDSRKSSSSTQPIAKDQALVFSWKGGETDYTPLADALKQLSQRPELFKFPKLQGKTLEALAAEIDPNIKVTRPNRSKDNPNRAQYPLEWTVDITMPDEKVALVIKNKDRIMLNAIELTSGTSRGSELYQMVGAFAYHNNLKFVGDTAGISPAGSARRLEHLISLVLKYGTTRFIEPHEDQNISWKEGDDAYNIVQLLKKSVELVSNDIPAIKDIRYDINEKRFYNIKTGNAVSDTWFQSIAKSFFPVRDESRNYDRPEPAFAGSTTLKRTALAHTVLQGDGQEVRDGILAWITQQLDSERLDPAVSALYYSKRSKKNPAQTGFFDDETPLAPIVESEEENQKRMKVGYTQVIRVNAAKLQAEFEKQNKEKLIHKPLRVEKLRGYAAWDAYPHVGITPYIDRLSIADGRHRVAVAAERGQDIEIAVPADRVETLQALLGSAEPATTKQDVRYSKNQAPAKSGVSVSSITETLVTPKEALWRHAGLTVRVVKSAAGLPADVRSKITNAEDVEGFYDRSTRTAYLLSDNLDSLERAREVLRHEAVGHYATHNLRDAIEFIRVMNAIERLEKVGNRKVRDAAAQIDKTQPGLGRRERQEEIFARLVESGEHETIGLIKSLTAKLMQAVKRFVDTLFSTGFSEKLTINDVLLWAKDTQALLDKGQQSTGQWVFSKNRQEFQDALNRGISIVYGKGEGSQNSGNPNGARSNLSGVQGTKTQRRNPPPFTGLGVITGESENSQGYVPLFTRSVIGVQVDSFKSGVNRVVSEQDAANVLAPLSREPQENLVALVTDAKGKPLAIIRHSVGTTDRSLSEPVILMGSIANIHNASQVWLAHNHPSGMTEQSESDIELLDDFKNLSNGTTLNVHGMVVIGTGGDATFVDSVSMNEKSLSALNPGQKPVKVLNRRFDIFTKGEKISSDNVMSLIDLISDPQGIVLLDNIGVPLAWVPMTMPEMKQLRTGQKTQGAERLFRIIDQVNAVGAIVKVPDVYEQEGKLAISNLNKFFNAANMTAFVAADELGNLRTMDADGADRFYYSFAGEKAKTADLTLLQQAKQRVESGEDAEQVRKETGWFKGLENKWKFEIDDSQALLNRDAILNAGAKRHTLTLGEVLNHPTLFYSYPSLSQVTVIGSVDLNNTLSGSASAELFGGEIGGTIKVSVPVSGKYKKTLLHEVQHLIQAYEGFAKGSAPTRTDKTAEDVGKVGRELANSITGLDRADYRALVQSLRDIGSRYQPTLLSSGTVSDQAAEMVDAIIIFATEESNFPDIVEIAQRWEKAAKNSQRSMEEQRALEKKAFKDYQSSAGEIESRDTENRLSLTPEQRQTTPPYRDTMFKDGIADEDVIVKMDGGMSPKSMQALIAEANSIGYQGKDAGEAIEWLRAKEKGLDMSYESRMRRAQAMGFDTNTTWYHGTSRSPKTEFLPTKNRELIHQKPDAFFFTSDPDIASSYHRTKENANVLPVFFRGNFEEISGIDEDTGDYRQMVDVADDDMLNIIQQQGYDGVVVSDVLDSPNFKYANREQNIAVVFDGKNVRSIFAAFDPDYSDSTNIMASIAPRNPDIRYSRKSSPSAPPFDEVGQDVTDMTKSTRNVFERLADKGRDYFKLGTALLTRQQLVELASRPIPGLKRVLLPSAEYFERAASLIDGIKSRIKREMYDGLVPQWLYEAGKNRKLAYDLDFILHGSTMHQVDPTKAEGPNPEDYKRGMTGTNTADEEFAIAQKWYETLRKRYLELQKVNPVLADVIGRVFENYTKINDMKYAAMKERVGRSGFGMARVMLDTARANDGTSKKAEIAGERTKAWLSGKEEDREAAEKVYQVARDIEEHGVKEDTDNQNSAGRVLVPVVPKIHKPIVDGDSERVVEAKKAYLALSAPQKTLYHERRKLHNIPLSQRLASLRGHDEQAFEALAQLISTTQRRAINILVDRVSEKSMVPEEHAAMQAELAKLPEEAQFLYRDIFSHFRERQRNLMKSIELYEEASRGVNPYAPLSRYGQYTVYAEKVVEKKDSQGQPVLDEEGNPEMETLLGYQKFEAIHDQRQAIAQLESKGWTVSTNFKTIQDKIEKAPNGTFVTKMYNFIDESVSDALERNVLKQSVYDLYLESLPDLSVRKHLITRKGIPGFNRDALRAYGQFMNGSSNMIARLRYADVLQEQLFQMENEVKSLSGHIEDQAKAGMLLDEMKKSYEWQMNPQNAAWANKLTSLGFIWHLTNPSTAIINLSQIPLMTFPELATKFGGGRSFSAIGKAMRDYMKVMEVRRKMGMNIIRPPMAFKATRDVLDANGQSRKEVKYLTYKDDAEYRNAIASLEGQGYTVDRSVNAGEAAIMETLGGEFNGDMGRFMEFLEKSGRVSRSATTQLAGLGEDNWQMDQGSLGTLSKIGSMTMQVGSFLFHHSEVANREITALASYRLMREELKNLPNQEEAHQKAQEYAYKTVAFTQGDYSNANRARFMRNNYARVAFLFKTYGQMMTFRMMRDAYQSIKSGTPEDKRQARVRLGYMVLNASLLGGAMGLPIYTAMISAWSLMEALTGDDDDPFDPELWMNQQLAEHLGDQGRKMVMTGPMGSAAMLLGAEDGVSLSSRLSLDIVRMWWRKVPGDKEGVALADEWLRQAAGPVYGLVPKMLTGVKDLKAGSAQLNDDLWWRGWESIMPSPLANAVKAYRYGTEGVKTRRGDDLMEDVTTGQIISQAMGFQPAKIGDLYAENTMLFERKAYLEKRSRNMISGLIRALEEGDTEAATEIREGIRRFNERNPLIRITSERIKNARRQKQKIRKDSDRGMFIPSKGMRRAIEQERFIQGE